MTDLDRDEWLAWRRQGIGGSDVPGILGLSSWSSPFSVWADKMGLLPEREETDRQRVGRAMESVIASEFHERTKLYVVGEQTMCEMPGPGLEWMRCTVDGFVAEAPDAARDEWLCPWEAKAYPVLDRSGLVRVDVRAQAIWSMYVTCSQQVWVSGVGPFLRFEHQQVSLADPDVAEDLTYIVKQVTDFYFDYVIPQVQPPVDGSDATSRAIASMWPEHEPGTVAELDHLADQIARLHELRAVRAAVEKLGAGIEAVENTIKAAMGDAEVGTVDGEPVFTLRAVERKPYTVEATTYRTLRAATAKDKEKF